MTSPVAPQTISSVVREIDSAIAIIEGGERTDRAARNRALAASEDLLAVLKSPKHIIFNHVFTISTDIHPPKNKQPLNNALRYGI